MPRNHIYLHYYYSSPSFVFIQHIAVLITVTLAKMSHSPGIGIVN